MKCFYFPLTNKQIKSDCEIAVRNLEAVATRYYIIKSRKDLPSKI